MIRFIGAMLALGGVLSLLHACIEARSDGIGTDTCWSMHVERYHWSGWLCAPAYDSDEETFIEERAYEMLGREYRRLRIECESRLYPTPSWCPDQETL